ncbi:hypothetical protein BGZ54_007408, partial [Gamsiella multidivaricata]
MDCIKGLHKIKNHGEPYLSMYCSCIVKYLREDPDGKDQERQAKRSIKLRMAMRNEKEEELILKFKMSANFMKRRSEQDTASTVDKGIANLFPNKGKESSTVQFNDTSYAKDLGVIAGEEYHNDCNETSSSTHSPESGDILDRDEIEKLIGKHQVQSGLPTSEAASRVGAKWPYFMDSPLSNREHGKELFKLPFYAYPEEKADNNDDVDVVSLAETSTKGVDKVFNVEPFVFTGCLSDIDTGTEFTNYFNECATLKYNRAAIPDFLTATTPTTGSIFAQLRKGLDVPPKHLDLIVKRKETVDISFGEVSYTKDFNKDQGDLCRLAIWSKRALGHLQAEYEELENPQLVFFHTVSTKCTIYQSIKCGGSGRSAL